MTAQHNLASQSLCDPGLIEEMQVQDHLIRFRPTQTGWVCFIARKGERPTILLAADRETLIAIMERLGVGRGRLKPALAVAGERLGRLKPNGQLRGYSPLSRLDEIELLQIGVAGKRRLWRALEHTHAAELASFDLGALAERATAQLDRLEALHVKAAALAL